MKGTIIYSNRPTDNIGAALISLALRMEGKQLPEVKVVVGKEA